MTPSTAAIVANIRKHRLNQHLTLSACARRCGISKGYLHSLESGRVQSIGLEMVGKIAVGLEVTFMELTGEQPAPIERLPNRES